MAHSPEKRKERQAQPDLQGPARAVIAQAGTRESTASRERRPSCRRRRRSVTPLHNPYDDPSSSVLVPSTAAQPRCGKRRTRKARFHREIRSVNSLFQLSDVRSVAGSF